MQTTNAKTFCIIQTLKASNNCIIDIYYHIIFKQSILQQQPASSQTGLSDVMEK